MSLIDTLSNPGPSGYYDPNFRIVFEDHLTYIKNYQRNLIISRDVDPNTGARFAGDWRGLMLELGEYPQMHWYHMRLNGYTCSSDYDGTQLTFDILSATVIEKLYNSYKTIRKN